MDVELVAVLVGTVMAVLSGGGAAVAWWRSNLSKAAKADAEAALDRAERQLIAIEEQAQAARQSADAAGEQAAHLEAMIAEVREQSGSLTKIAEATARRPIEAVHVQGYLYRLRNNTSSDMVIEQVDNRAKFQRLDGLESWTEIAAGESIEFRADGSWGMPVPTTLILGLMGEDRPRSVELPPRPRKATGAAGQS